jgi:pSer/pThr/pTyr-binding forkhead associated (FHA) protein/multidrug efflux pump subunit AcrA (membrane-fusion protein)
MPADPHLPVGAYRANIYLYDPFGRIDWYALVASSFEGDRFFTLGRGPDCDINLNDGAVSTRHAYIAAEGRELVLRDLQSTNGTRIDGERIAERVLAHGDVIHIGASDLRFLYSYRDSPVHLVLEFLAGPYSGRVLATTGASTSIGRLNCQVNLQGPDIASQHVRIDAFGDELLFVVNLQRKRPIWVNDVPVTGICPARSGDRLRLGEHEMRLGVATPAQVADATPQPDGTLLINEPPGLDEPTAHEQAHRFDSTELQASLTPKSAAERRAEAEAEIIQHALFLSPTSPPKGQPPPMGPTAELETEDGALTPPEVRWREARTVRRPPASARRALFFGVLLGAIIGGAALWEVPQSLTLHGTLRASSETSLVATARGQIEHTYVRVGEVVAPGTVIAHLIDLDIQSEIDRVSADIKVLETRATTPKILEAPPVPAALRAELHRAEAALDAARDARRAHLQAFNRREVSLEQLETARSQEQTATRALLALRARVESVRNTVITQDQGPSTAHLTAISNLIARRERLQRRLRVSITANRGGLLTAVHNGPTLRTGVEVRAGAPLFIVLGVDPIEVQLPIAAEHLAAAHAAKAQLSVADGPPQAVQFGPATPAEHDQHVVRSSLPNPDAALRPGLPVTAVITRPATNLLSHTWKTLTE